MEKATKTKIIIFSSLGIAVLFIILLFFYFGGKAEQEENVSVRAESEELTIQDIMNSQENNPSYKEENNTFLASTNLENEDIEVKELQEQLRANQINTPSYYYEEEEPIREIKKEKKVEKIDEIVEVDSQEEKEKIEETISPLSTPQKRRFYGGRDQELNNNILQAKVAGTQKVGVGNTLKLQLLEDLKIGEFIIPKGTPVYGVVDFQNNRLSVTIQSIRYKDNIYPFHKVVYDRDGIVGISVPENELAEVSQQVTEEGTNTISFSSTGSTLIDAGVNTATNVAKKIIGKKKIAITVKSNYLVFLK